MKRIRFSIASLLIVVLFLAVALAALRQSTALWASAVFTATLAMLLGSILFAVHRIARRRAFWLGFAVFGWVCLVASLVPAVESRLLTTKLLAYAGSKVLPSDDGTGLSNSMWEARALDPFRGTQATLDRSVEWLWRLAAGRALAGTTGTLENFVRIGHSLFALVAAFSGGQLSRYLAGRYRQNSDSDNKPVTPVPSA